MHSVGPSEFQKSYGPKSRFLSDHYEQAYLLAKSRPPLPKQQLADEMDTSASSSKLHPTQKPVSTWVQLIPNFTLPRELTCECK